MKIAIVGTSNSIVRDGWVKYYCELVQSAQIDNFSLGANSSLYGHYILEKKLILEKYDYCIVDFAVNDQYFLDSGIISEELLVASYLDLIRKFKRSRCIPIFIVLPVASHYLEGSEYSIIRKHMVCLCRIFGIMYVDVYDFVEGLFNKYPEELLFRDNMHISSIVAKSFAAQMATINEEAKNTFQNKLDVEIPSFNFRIKRHEEIEFIHCEQLLRERSIAKFNVMRASVESESQIILYGQDLLCGIFFYVTAKTNYIYLSADNGIAREFMTNASWIDIFNLRQFKRPLKSHNGIIKVSLSDCTNHINEKNNICEPSHNLELEVVDFLICDGSYEDKLDVLRKYMTHNRTIIIEYTDYHKFMKQNFRTMLDVIEPAIIDDIMRYKKGAFKQVIPVVRDMFKAINANQKQVIIFGAGGMGKALIESQIFAGEIKFVIDNNPQKWGENFGELTICSPNEILKVENKLILVASMYFVEIKEQLMAMGLNENKEFIDAYPIYQLLN